MSAKQGRPFSEKFASALHYAVKVHGKQVRERTQKPILGHLLSVTSIVIEYGDDETLAIAALLHDAVEDQGGLPRLRDIQKKFGKRVAHIVESCTDSLQDPPPPWRERKEAYLKRLVHHDVATRLVSAADKLSNARETLKDVREHGPAWFERFEGGKAGTLWYYRGLVTAFRKAGSNPLVEEYDRVVTELERLNRQAGIRRRADERNRDLPALRHTDA